MDETRKGNKNLKLFKKGQSGNPGGRPHIPDDIRKARKENQISVARALNKFMYLSLDELDLVIKDQKTEVLDMLIARIISKCMKEGDYMRFNFILDRMIGKVTEKIEHSLPKPTMIKLRGEDAVLVLDHKHDNEDDEPE